MTASAQRASVGDAIVLIVAMVFPSLMSWLEFRVLAVQASTGGHNPAVQAAFTIGKILQFALPLLYVNGVTWRRRQLILPGSFRPAGLGIGIAFGLAVAAGTLGLYFLWLKHTALFQAVGGRVYAWLAQFNLASPRGFLLMAAFISVPHSFLEEYYWRWFVFGWLRKFVPLSWALTLAALAFMAHHVVVLGVYLEGYFWEAAVPFSLCVAGGGIAWALLYHYTGSLLGPWISHLVVDVSLMLLGYDLLWPYWGVES